MKLQPIDEIPKAPVVQPVEMIPENELTFQTQREASSSKHHTSEDPKMLGNQKKPIPINETVEELNKKLLGRDLKMKFEVHKRTGYTLVRLVDMQTGDVLKEIPPENMLNVIGKIWDDMGIAIDRKG